MAGTRDAVRDELAGARCPRPRPTGQPIQVELVDPHSGTAHTITAIGVIDSKIGSLTGLFAAQDAIDAIYGTATVTSYDVALKDSGQADAVAKEIEAALLTPSVQGTSIQDEMEESQQQSSGFLYIIEGLIGLGLLVGAAAIGVIAFHAVVERRQQIGVLRAIGFRHEMVSLSFLVETAFVVGLGALSGTALGLRLAYNMMKNDETGSSMGDFMVPWPVILTVLVATVALLMTWLPSRQAARIAPAEALRYE